MALSLSEYFDMARQWAHEGKCTNRSNENVDVCIDGRLETLKPGESTPSGRDCEGFIHPDGSATKIWGKTGVTTEQTREWVAKNWPGCVRKAGGDPAPPPRPSGPGVGGGGKGDRVDR